MNKNYLLLLSQIILSLLIGLYMVGIPVERSVSAIVLIYFTYKMFAIRLANVGKVIAYFSVACIGAIGLYLY